MISEPSWPRALRRALTFCLGEGFDPGAVEVERWRRLFSPKETYRITIGDEVLYAVHHRLEDGSDGMVQLYVRILGQLWAVNKLDDVQESVAYAKRTLIQGVAGFCAVALVLGLLTASGIGDQQISFSVTF